MIFRANSPLVFQLKTNKMHLNKLLIAVLLLFSSATICKSQSKGLFEGAGDSHKFNTVIVMNLKNKQDKGFFNAFGQIDPYRLDDKFIIAGPVNTIDTTDKLKIIIRFKIEKPSLVNIGTAELYIEPGDSLDMDYTVLLNTPMRFIDTVHINTGNVFFTKYNSMRNNKITNYQLHMIRDVINFKRKEEFIAYTSEKNLNTLTNNIIKLIYDEFPKLKKDSFTYSNVRKYCFNQVYANVFGNLGEVYKKLNPETQRCVDNIEHSMVATYYRQKNMFGSPAYWLAWFGAYEFYRAKKYDLNRIVDQFKGCNDTIKQYIILRCMKDATPYKANEKVNANQLVAKFTYPPFKPIAYKYLNDANYGTAIGRNLNIIIRNIEAYNVKGDIVHFYDLFKSARQPYVLTAICRTTSPASIDDIAAYSQTHKLDNSTKVEPIWIFLEQDMSQWLEVIAQYHLKKENCFLIIDKRFMGEFGKSFGWEGDFPHYSLFSNEGEMLNNKITSFAEVNENVLATDK
jgi:hypothetical protein